MALAKTASVTPQSLVASSLTDEFAIIFRSQWSNSRVYRLDHFLLIHDFDEVKEVQDIASGTADVGHALEQLSNTAQSLVKNVSGAEISKLEIVVKAGTDLGPSYKRSGDQLLQFNSQTNKWNPVRILGKVVHVTELLPGPVPSSLRE